MLLELLVCFCQGHRNCVQKTNDSFITIFEEFKTVLLGAEINRKFLFHMVNSVGELSTGHDRSSTTILAHERELWVCYSEMPGVHRDGMEKHTESKVWSFDAAWEESTICFVFGVWDQEGRSACWPGPVSSGSFSQGVRVI